MRFTLQNILKKTETVYPGLKSHPSHDLYAGMINSEYGFGGMMTLDVGSLQSQCLNGVNANQLRVFSSEFRFL
jgi:cystathionine beta-lyase/cystathionine gamma-synthase